MSKRNVTMVAMGAVVLLVAGGLYASNMGFKLNYTLSPPGINGSLSGTQSIALPYNQQTSIVKASDLRTDVNATVPSSFVSLSRFAKTTDSLVGYAGGALDLPADFNLTPGEGYRVQVAGAGAVNYIIVGSHDPGLVVNLDAPGTSGSLSGTNDFAFPYHGTATTASDLLNEINAQGAGVGTVVSVSRFNRTTDSLFGYAGGALDLPNNFALTPGESYRVQVSTDVSYVPSHF